MASYSYTVGIGGDFANFADAYSFLLALPGVVENDYTFNAISDTTHDSFPTDQLNISTVVDPILIFNGNGYLVTTGGSGIDIHASGSWFQGESTTIIIDGFRINIVTTSEFPDEHFGVRIRNYSDNEATRISNCFVYNLLPNNVSTAFCPSFREIGTGHEYNYTSMYNCVAYNCSTGISRSNTTNNGTYKTPLRIIENCTFFNCGFGDLEDSRIQGGYALVVDNTPVSKDPFSYRNVALLRDDGVAGRDVFYQHNASYVTSFNNCATSDPSTFSDLNSAYPGRVFNCLDGLVAADQLRSTVFGHLRFLRPKMAAAGIGIYNGGVVPTYPTTDYDGTVYGLYGYYPIGAFQLAFSVEDDVEIEVDLPNLEIEIPPELEETVDEYEWDFGDGETSGERDPVHDYMPGEYVVTVTVTSRDGSTASVNTTIYVYENDYTAGGRNITKSTDIFRFGLPQEKKQGIGWCEYSGSNYPRAIGLVGACKIFNDTDEERVIVTDCDSFKHYWLGKEDHWVDGGNESYGGSEIEADILFRENEPANGATIKLRHSESEADLKPWLKSRRNTGDYGPYGFKTNFNASMYFREDSTPEDRAVVKYFPRKAQIVSDRHIESETIQGGLRITGAPWRLTDVQMWYEEIDTAAAPPEKQMSEKTWSEMLTESILWIGRSRDLVASDGTFVLPWDNGAGERTTGQYTGVTAGPDGNSKSAIAFSSGYLTSDVTIESGDLTMNMWMKSWGNPCTIIQVDDLTVSLSASDDWTLNWSDDNDTVSFPLDISSTSWKMLTVVRDCLSLKVYINGALVNTRILTRSNTYSGPITLYNGSITGFEPRFVQYALDGDAVKWIYDDVIENGGNSVCAMY